MVTHFVWIIQRLASSRRPVKYYYEASCRAMTAHTWKHRSYVPTSWVILQTRLKKGCLHMRNPVLELADLMKGYCPSWYFWGLLSGAAFRNSLHGSLSPTIGWSFFLAGSSPAGFEGPASAIICASCLVGDDPGDHPTSSNFLASSLLLFILPGVGGLWFCLGLCLCLGLCPHPGPLSLLPTSRCDLSLNSHHAGMKNQPIRGLGGHPGRCAPFTLT